MLRIFIALTVLVVAGGFYAIHNQHKPTLPDEGILPPRAQSVNFGDLQFNPISGLLLDASSRKLGGPTVQDVDAIESHIESLRQHAIATVAPLDTKTYTASINAVLACTDQVISAKKPGDQPECLKTVLRQLGTLPTNQ